MKDTVVFLSIFDATKFSKRVRNPFRKRLKLPELLKKHHILYTMHNNTIIFPEGKLKIGTIYDDVFQKTSYSFEPVNKKETIEDYESTIGQFGFCVNLLHAHSLLADSSYFHLNNIFSLQSFLVKINKRIFQIDPFAFSLNGMIIVAFEMINYATGKPLGKNDSYAKVKNWNLRTVHKIRYFDEEEFRDSNQTIPQIIYGTISNFYYELSGKRYRIKEYSYVHDTLVISNQIDNVEKYMRRLLGVITLPSPIENIGTTKNYKYYMQDSAGVITNFEDKNIDTVLYSGIMLEAIKLYIYMFQIVNADIVEDLNKLMRNDLYLENLFHAPSVPIETSNFLRAIYSSPSYQHRRESIKLKISYIKTENDVRKNRNTILLNIILYIASLLGTIQTMDILDNRLNIPFKYSIIVVLLIFGTMGIIWAITEYCHNKKF